MDMTLPNWERIYFRPWGKGSMHQKTRYLNDRNMASWRVDQNLYYKSDEHDESDEHDDSLFLERASLLKLFYRKYGNA